MTAYQVTKTEKFSDITIRIRRARSAAWLPVRLLATRAAWVQVDDGDGPLWVLIDHIHLADWPKLSPGKIETSVLRR